MEPVYEDLDRLFDKEEYMNYLRDIDLEENVITSPKAAVRMLLDQLIKGENQSYDFLVRSLQVLAKEHDLEDYTDIDESELKVTFENDVNCKLYKITEQQKDDKSRISNLVKKIEGELYGTDSVDTLAVDGYLSSLSWHVGVYRPSNRNLTIKRK